MLNIILDKLKLVLNQIIEQMIQWWMTPKLPRQDIYELPLLKNKSQMAKWSHYFTAWITHPIKRRLAKQYFEFMKKYSKVRVIGITASAGKSTTVELLKSILSLDGSTVATPHSIDPVYNIPNTILKCKPNTKYLILEMSVEFPGEMDYYLWLCQPDIGVILNIFPTHLSNFGNVNGVLAEKSKLVVSLNSNDTAVLNKNDIHLKKLAANLKCKVAWFDSKSDLLQNNINAAIKIADILGVNKNKIIKGILLFKNPQHRLQLIKLNNGVQILDDTYNSNPEAANMALDYFAKNAKGKWIAVVGDMLELGDFEKEAHVNLGKKLSRMNFTCVVGVGKAIKYTLDSISNPKIKKIMTKNSTEAIIKIRPLITKDVSLFVKGSRSIGLDSLISELSSVDK
jgi:UDP-N-acetylmuramoyl-tripeptide--D-alanyl-D-alanine ligase